MIDSHAHVGDESFDTDRDAVLTRAVEAGLDGIVCIGQDAATSRRALDLCVRGFAGLRLAPTVGLHPHEARRLREESPLLEPMAADSSVKAVGETGLDFHYNYSSPDLQRENFRWHLTLARRVAKPVVVHVREAHREAVEDLRAAGNGVDFVIHCFTGGANEARQYLDLGGSISFSGIVTFKNAESIREAARLVPDGRILAETDSPYLSPEPLRGKRCEPAFVRRTIERLASERQQTVEYVSQTTAANAASIFFR